MLNISENAFRDYIFNNHKEDFSSLIAGRREPVEWYGEEFPPLHFLLRRKVERAINEILDQLEELVLTAKELRLEKMALIRLAWIFLGARILQASLSSS